MGLIPTICRFVISLHHRVELQGPVLTLGNQDVWASHADLKGYFSDIGCGYTEVQPHNHTSKLLSQYEEAADFVHAETFFQMLGIDDYYDMDLLDMDSPRILHDLNLPVAEEFQEKFGLIIDGGTMEHIFDVRQVMENIVGMCRPSGWVVHINPASNYMDHGFYSFSPCFFYDFYRANEFEDFVCHIIQVNPENLREPCPVFEYSYGMDMRDLLDPERQVLIFFAARKTRSIESVVNPTQGIYQSTPPTWADEPKTNGAEHVSEHDSITEKVIGARLLPIIRPIRPYLGAVRQKLSRQKPIPARSFRTLDKL